MDRNKITKNHLVSFALLIQFLIIVCLISGTGATKIGKENKLQVPPANVGIVNNETQEESLKKKYSTDLPLEYFDGLNMGGDSNVTYLEKLGYQGEVVPINKNPQEISVMDEPFTGFDNLPNKYDLFKPYWGTPVDVDSDGNDEKIFYYATAMNHTPHVATVVKNDKIIFRAEGPGIQLVPSESRNGFYIEEYYWNDVPAANTKVTRYVHKDGKFIPVWYRQIFVLEVQKQ